MTKPRSCSQAFTIVELLVVISIVALLIALLLPVLASSRDLARETMCMGNIRQIYTGICTYSNDFDRYVPPAWYIMERQWTGWSWPMFLHNMMGSYIDPRSRGWLDPGWPDDQVYQDGLTCNGSQEDDGAGLVPGTPHNFGEGYYYTAYMWTSFWGPLLQPRYTLDVRFDVPRYPTQAKILSCMLDQQAPSLGTVGPHQAGTSWNVLWLDGSQTKSKGFFAVGDFTLYCNYSGNWFP